jgi:hypothetical protein
MNNNKAILFVDWFVSFGYASTNFLKPNYESVLF